MSGSWTLKAGRPVITWYCFGCLAPFETQRTITSLTSKPWGPADTCDLSIRIPKLHIEVSQWGWRRKGRASRASAGLQLVSLARATEAWRPRFLSAVPQDTGCRVAPAAPPGRRSLHPQCRRLPGVFCAQGVAGSARTRSGVGGRGVSADTVVTELWPWP